MESATLPVRVDKSHLVTIGERLYAESVELVRELVNNAYDADATEVHVSMTDEEIRVGDNGLGMDLDGLREYFTIGTSDKRLHPRSLRFGRPRIGQFGIGKFATLSACDRFVVSSQRGTFAAEVVFDKQAWESAGDRWDLPMRLVVPDPARADGTMVRLSRLRRRFDEAEVERRIIESVPLSAPDFAVFLNGRRVMPLRLPGHRIPVLEGTPFGTVHGEIIIVPVHLASTTEVGIEVKVRQVTVRRDLFGTDGRDAIRIRGEVHADFLPVTADRTGFVRDTEEYRAFLQVMERVTAGVRTTLGQLSDRTERQKGRQAVREAFRRIQRALAKNPDLSPF
jgi:Histidine kinase-, DNA gyrase B-, and HSP90-like ATPase